MEVAERLIHRLVVDGRKSKRASALNSSLMEDNQVCEARQRCVAVGIQLFGLHFGHN